MYGLLRLAKDDPQSLKELRDYLSKEKIQYIIINAEKSLPGSTLGSLFVIEYSDSKERDEIIYHMRSVLEVPRPLDFSEIKGRDSLQHACIKVEAALKVVARVQLDFMSKLDQKSRERLFSGELNNHDLYSQLASALFKD